MVYTKDVGADVHFVLNDLTFVWDEEKAESNLVKHDGIAFQQAVEVFFDPFLVVVDASRNDEERNAVMGLDRHWNLLYVVYVELDKDLIRVISARKATSREYKEYEG